AQERPVNFRIYGTACRRRSSSGAARWTSGTARARWNGTTWTGRTGRRARIGAAFLEFAVVIAGAKDRYDIGCRRTCKKVAVGGVNHQARSPQFRVDADRESWLNSRHHGVRFGGNSGVSAIGNINGSQLVWLRLRLKRILLPDGDPGIGCNAGRQD